MKILLPFSVVMLIMSCSTRHDARKPPDATDEVNDHRPDTVLYQKQTVHYFSSLTARDSFKIYVAGDSFEEGLVRFQIISHKGTLLLEDTFRTNFLLDYGLKMNATAGEKEEYIKNRIDTFFQEENFQQPAIEGGAAFDADYSQKEIWEDIKSDPSAIGFYYLLGKEDGRHIAYSKKSEKVELYYNCC